MRNAGLDESQIGMKIAGRNINNLRYVDVTTDMAEIKEELKSLLMRKEESEKAGLNSAFRKLRSWHLVPLLHGQIDGETVTDFIFLGSKITADGECSHEIKSRLLLGRKAMTKLDSILKSRDVTLPRNFYIISATVFPVVMYGCESWTVKQAEC